jgi:hypothetical protein
MKGDKTSDLENTRYEWNIFHLFEKEPFGDWNEE